MQGPKCLTLLPSLLCLQTDISQVVIDQMKDKHAHMKRLSYHVSDCRNMPEFFDCQYGSAIDKGTVDGLLCCGDGVNNVLSMFAEIARSVAVAILCLHNSQA